MSVKDFINKCRALLASLYVARTTVAVVASALIARACRLQEPSWAVVTSIIVMQSSLGAAWEVSRQRIAGTFLGGVTGALLLTFFSRSLLVLAIGILVMGFVCALLRLPQSAYRFAGVALVIIALPAYSNPSWVIALHRFLEVCLGIVIGMGVMAVWRPQSKSGSPRRYGDTEAGSRSHEPPQTSS